MKEVVKRLLLTAGIMTAGASALSNSLSQESGCFGPLHGVKDGFVCELGDHMELYTRNNGSFTIPGEYETLVEKEGVLYVSGRENGDCFTEVVDAQGNTRVNASRPSHVNQVTEDVVRYYIIENQVYHAFSEDRTTGEIIITYTQYIPPQYPTKDSCLKEEDET